MNPKVSVIVPMYNAQETIVATMKSIQAQTLKDIEIICVDDGSSDDTFSILQEIQKKDERVHLVAQDNKGAGAARNTGLKAASGEYLSFLDADDLFESTMLEKAYKKAIETDADIVVFRSDQFREDIQEFQPAKWTLRMEELPPYRPMDFRSFTDNVFKVFVGWAWDKLFKHSFVREKELRFQELRTSNDMLFVFSAIVTARRIEVIDEVLAHQRRNNPASLSNTREKSWDCFYTALNALKENLIRFGLYEELRQDYINYCLHFSLWNLYTIKGEKREVLFHKLKEEWFREFGITDRGADYFYNKNEHKKYLLIMNSNYVVWNQLTARG